MEKLTLEQVENFIRNRIDELNIADNNFCAKRWDMEQPAAVRMIYREQSNNVTFARQELESLLQKMGLPRFKENTLNLKENGK